jgi:hypothetical protein
MQRTHMTNFFNPTQPNPSLYIPCMYLNAMICNYLVCMLSTTWLKISPISMILKLRHAPQLGGGMHEVTLESFVQALQM